ncbi:hypothetical protein PMAYCL1PPCAC_28516, partial [Pristionchus mayeri]
IFATLLLSSSFSQPNDDGLSCYFQQEKGFTRCYSDRRNLVPVCTYKREGGMIRQGCLLIDPVSAGVACAADCVLRVSSDDQQPHAACCCWTPLCNGKDSVV